MGEATGAETAPKNLIVCSDGTGNKGGKARGTNVWRLYQAIDQSPAPGKGKRRQIAYHDDGVGTESLKYVRAVTGAFGLGISRNLRELYSFLTLNYEEGDAIYLFGFSRGAFTVRVLAAMIGQCGLPKRVVDRRELSPIEVARHAETALKAYKGRRRTPPVIDSNTHHEPRIRCVGVWDTVDALGLPFDELTAAFRSVFRLRFQDNKLGEKVDRGLHALAIDDERHTFHPVMWEPDPEASDPSTPKRIEQVWFAGAHSNVGGGYPKDQLAHIPLLWMMERAQAVEEDGAAQLRFHSEIQDTYRRKVPFDDKNSSEIEDAYRRQALFNGHAYDSRAGLGVYYRYAPRRITEAGAPTALTPGTGDGKRPGSGAAPEPRIHASVLWRIHDECDFYAPTGIPERYAIEGDTGFPVAELPAKEKHATRRLRAMDKAFDLIVGRRILYQAMVWWSLWMLLAGWVYSLEALPLASGPIAWLQQLLAGVLPFALGDVFVGYQKYPVRFWSFLGVYLGLWCSGRYLMKQTREVAVAAWHRGFGQEATLPNCGWLAPLSALRSLRDRPTVSRARAWLRQWVAPVASVLALLLLIAARPLWHTWHPEPGPVQHTEGPRTTLVAPQVVSFDTRQALFATGLWLAAGQRYGIEVTALPTPWRDAHYKASPRGIEAAWQDNPVMWFAIPLRRDLSAPWFQLRGRILSTGGAEQSFAIGEGTVLQTQREGELFLYVNDAPGFYGNNSGTARVRVAAWPRGRVPSHGEPVAITRGR